ncbi:MAG TPA: ABC transporter ATP-binding protein [Geminicoccaceae bacterium]|nr:ABC transporter ATP-binding protein [Geminicoccus sp.]HMU51805.1 ABC transporter ATP-binding protein [Geminicoccaceae bacterium]
MGATLEISQLDKRYATFAALDGVSMSVSGGEMVAILGPSGCGKTTTLRTVAGFIEPSGGDIRIDGQSVLGLPTHRRNLGIVFQSYALFPHYTVEQNIAFGLKMRKQPEEIIAGRVMEMLRLVKLEKLAARYPRELSGGQQQRVALARALAPQPNLLLMDEPLSNLDASLRLEVSRDIRLLQREAGLTSIMVTHDQQEAMSMADRLVVMSGGKVQQIGTPQDLYERPANTFVTSFIGASKLIPGVLDGQSFEPAGAPKLRLQRNYKRKGAGTLALRPERLRLVDPRESALGALEGRVELATYLGAVVEHVVIVGEDLRVIVRGTSSAGEEARIRAPGERVAVEWAPDGEQLFDAEGRAITSAG